MNMLPSKKDVLAACRGEIARDHELLHAIGELARLHAERLSAICERVAEIDSTRTELTKNIDHWIDRHLPPSHGGARIHTETIGAVVDRLAQLTAHAHAILIGPAPPRELCDAWELVAELAVAYEDLTDEVAIGHRRLPGSH
ncbi:DUF4254 domain-containing protein [Nocardia macrotermitis]|nr:DUF4254 domain-containing protein [Nocardia macrotermitis]